MTMQPRCGIKVKLTEVTVELSLIEGLAVPSLGPALPTFGFKVQPHGNAMHGHAPPSRAAASHHVLADVTMMVKLGGRGVPHALIAARTGNSAFNDVNVKLSVQKEAALSNLKLLN
jgi:hypothetical protein